MKKKKKRKVIGIMKDEKGSNIITKLAATAPKAYGHIIQKVDHKIKNNEFIRAKEIKKISI